MAVDVFGVDYGDVLQHLPIDSSQIGPSSEPISTSDLALYIEEAGGELAGYLAKMGYDTDDLTADVLAQLRNAIVSYAVQRALGAMGYSGALYDNARREYQRILKALGDRPALAAGYSRKPATNINPMPPPSRFGGSTYEF